MENPRSLESGTNPAPFVGVSNDVIDNRCLSSDDISSGADSGTSQTRLDLDSTSQQQEPSCVGGWLYNRTCQVLIKLPCKRWSCRRCAERKGRAICKRLKLSGNQEKLNRLLTLPFALDEKRNWRDAIQESGVVLNRFMTSLKKHYRGLLYFWTREVGKKSNMVHFHVLMDRYVPKQLVSNLWAKAGGGYVVDIGIVKKSTSYVLKYLRKLPDYAEDVWKALYKKRRYSTSAKLLAPALKGDLIGAWVFLDVATGSSLISESRRNHSGLFVYTFDTC